MAGTFLTIFSAASLSALALVSTSASAATVNLNTSIGARPHVHLNAPLHMGIRPHAFRDLDIADGCTAEQRLKSNKRDRRCRQQR